MQTKTWLIALSALALTAMGTSGLAASNKGVIHKVPAVKGTMLGKHLFLPRMDPRKGKMLFASKGCVTCHSINGVGGDDAPHLDAKTMPKVMNPFDFVAKMWRAAPAMIAAQNDELGHQILFTGQELADIIAFVHDPKTQKTFTLNDVPEKVRAKIMSDDEDMSGMKKDEDKKDDKKKSSD